MEFNAKAFKALAGEFLVTYLFMYTICMNGLQNAGPVASALSCGMSAVALIYAFGGISGAHFNPAVTVGALLFGKIDLVQGILYIVLQNVAAIAAVATCAALAPKAQTAALQALVVNPALDMIPAIGQEVVLTFMLVFVIYATAMGINTEKSLDGDGKAADQAAAKMNFAPIAIGFTLGFLCFLGGCFNPARATGAAVLSMDFKNVWIYWVGDLVGAALAAAVYQFGFAV